MEKIFINARIKELRKALKLSQSEFGDRIGLKQGAISRVEQEGVPVTEQNIKLICEKFHVRREWLTEGKGEMLQETEETLFAAFAQRHSLTEPEQKVARYLLQLTSEERQSVLRHVLALADTLRTESPAQDQPADAPPVPESDTPVEEPAPENLTDEEKEILRQLRLEKSTKTSSASPSIA